MSIPKLKVYRLDKDYIQANDSDIQSVNSDEMYPVVPKPLDPDYAKLLVGVEHRDTAVAIRDYTDGSPNYHYVMVGMKPIYGEGGLVDSYSLNLTDNISCDGWRIDKSSLKLYIKRSPLLSEESSSSEGELLTAEWIEYTSDSNWRCLFTDEKMVYDVLGAEIADIEANAASIISRRQKKMISIELGELLFLDAAFWVDVGEGLTEYSEFKPIENVVIGYQMYKEVLDTDLVTDYETDGIVPFGSIYNGGRTGYSNNKDYPDELLINEGNYTFRRQIYPLRQIVAQTSAKALLVGTNDFYQDVEIESNGTIVVTHTANWIQSGELSPKLFERITVYDAEDSPHVVYKEMKLNEQYTRSPLASYKDPGTGDTIGKYTFNLISDYYRVVTGVGSSVLKFPEEVFVRYNEVDDLLGDIFDFDYEYNVVSGDNLIENTTAGEYENTGVCIFGNSPDGYIYKKKNILAIQSTASTLTDDDIEITIGEPATSESFVLPVDYYFDANYPLEIYNNGVKIYDSVAGDVGDDFAVTYNGGTRTVTITLNEAVALPEDVMVIYFEQHKIGFGKVEGETYNYWCMGYRVSCWEKSNYTDTFISPNQNWVANHLNNNPDIFKGYAIYEGVGTEEVPDSGLNFYFLESGYNIYYRDGYIVLSLKTYRVLTIDEAKNFAGFDTTDNTADGFKPSTTGVRANYAYYAGLVNLTGAIVRNYTARGGKYAYKIFDEELYPFSLERRMITRNDSYMPSFFECAGKNLPDINVFTGQSLVKFTAINTSYGEGVRVNTADNRINSILFTFDTNTPSSWIKIFVNHSYDEDYVRIVDEVVQLTDDDIPIYCYYDDNISVSSPYSSGVLHIDTGEEGSSSSSEGDGYLNELERTSDLFAEGMFFDGSEGVNVVETIPSFTYSNVNWEYDVVFELVGYRGSSSIEFLVYRKERT